MVSRAAVWRASEALQASSGLSPVRLFRALGQLGWATASLLVVAGFKFATVGVIYAVLLAFAVQEAGAAATLYRLASGPEPEAVATRAALTNYLRLRSIGTGRRWRQERKATRCRHSSGGTR